jgi:hypothetical protein
MTRYGSKCLLLALLCLSNDSPVGAEGPVPPSARSTPEEFGTEDFGWTTILGIEHQPVSSDDSTYVGFQDGSIFRASGSSATYVAQLSLPSGARLREVVWFVKDDSAANDLNLYVYRVCQSNTRPIDPPLAEPLDGISSSGTGEDAYTVHLDPGEVIDNKNCAYVVATQFDLNETIALVLRKVRVGWQRQVSPPPAVATFPNDVPTTHPYFQFVEALAAAGVTAGCAPQSFCPTNPITRGEMAVFLAAALGLHFSN